MDAIELLKDDHKTVRELFARIAETEAEDAEERAELLARLQPALKAHELIEQEIFYPAAEEIDEETEEEVSHAYEEHHVVDLVVTELAELDPADETWGAKAHVLKEMVEHHIEEEEGELLPNAEKALGEERLAELGERMQERKEAALGELEGAAVGAGREERGGKSSRGRGRSSAKGGAKRGGTTRKSAAKPAAKRGGSTGKGRR